MKRQELQARGLLTACVLCLVMVRGAGVVCGDTFRLVGGRVIEGELLKERSDSYVVDVGFEVLVIPKKAVEEHLTGSEEPVRAEAPEGKPSAVADEPATSAQPSGGLYATAEQVARGVRETAQKFGPAVVTVSTPRGLGSGFVIDAGGHVVTNAHVIQRETRMIQI